MNSRWNENFIIFTMELVSTCFDDRIKIKASRAHEESTLGQTWSKLLKISEKLGFDIKPWKMLFFEDIDLVWPLVNPGLTKGILAKKATLSTLMVERVVPRHYICTCDHVETKWYFLGFSRSSTQIEDRQNTVSTVGTLWDVLSLEVLGNDMLARFFSF